MSEGKEKKQAPEKFHYVKGMKLEKADKLRIGQDFIMEYFEANEDSISQKDWDKWIATAEKIEADEALDTSTKKFSQLREAFCAQFIQELAKTEEKKETFLERMKRFRK